MTVVLFAAGLSVGGGTSMALVLLAPLVGGIGGGLLVRRWANGPGKL